jgi:hypothetical protein
MRKQVAGLMLSLALLTGCGTPGFMLGGSGDTLEGLGTKDGKDWTVFIYMAADNSLTEAADLDLNELEAGLTSDRVRFVVLVDQAKQGDSRILEIRPDSRGMNETLVSAAVDDQGAVIPASREIDTGSAATLKRFLEWGTKRYASRRAMLVMWNHGGATFSDPDHLKSFCWDDTSKTHLNLADLWKTAQHLATRTQFDITGFDTCLLGHLETAYQFKRISDFLVSSERVSPGHGWDYQALARTLSRKPGIYPRELADAIAKDYQAFYQRQGETTTISVTDLQKVGDRLVPSVNALAKNLTALVPARSSREALSESLFAALSAASGSGERNAIDLGYFGDLLQKNPKLPKETHALAAKMTQELRRAVETNLTTGTAAGKYQGLKIYFAWHYDKAYADPSHQFFGTQAWTDFLKAYDKAQPPSGGGQTPMPNPGFPGPGIGPM